MQERKREKALNCPKCNRPIKPNEAYCPGCGVKFRFIPQTQNDQTQPIPVVAVDEPKASPFLPFIIETLIGIGSTVLIYITYYFVLFGLLGFYKINLDSLMIINLFVALLGLFFTYATVVGWYGKFTFLGFLNLAIIMSIPFIGWITIPSTGRGLIILAKNKPRILIHEPSRAGLVLTVLGLVVLFAVFIDTWQDASSDPYVYPSDPNVFSPFSTRLPTRTPALMSTIIEMRKLTMTASGNSRDTCIQWSEVTASMEGDFICVKGIVVDTYFAEKGTYIRFSNDATSFYFIDLYQGDSAFYYPDLRNGDCVYTSGIVKTFMGIPRIEITKKLYKCD